MNCVAQVLNRPRFLLTNTYKSVSRLGEGGTQATNEDKYTQF